MLKVINTRGWRVNAAWVAVGLMGLFGLAAPVAANELPNYPFIHVNGVASLAVVPDTGEIDFELVANDKDAQVAWDTVQARLASLRALIDAQGAGVVEVDIAEISRASNVRKLEPMADGSKPAGSDVRVTVHLTVRKLSNWAAMVTPLVTMPNVEGFVTVFSSSQHEKIEADLMAQAIKDATRKGENLAAGFGKKLAGVGAVSSGSLKNLSNAIGLATAESFREPKRERPPAGTDFTMIGLLKLYQAVDVIFKLK